ALAYAAQTAQPAADFAIRFDHKDCGYEYLDTFKGTYSQFGIAAPVPFRLSDEQRTRVFRAIMTARFFDLPPMIYSGDGGNWQYELEVQNAGRRHTVSWKGRSESEADTRLSELLHTILEILRTHPDVPRGDGCFGGPPTVR